MMILVLVLALCHRHAAFLLARTELKWNLQSEGATDSLHPLAPHCSPTRFSLKCQQRDVQAAAKRARFAGGFFKAARRRRDASG